jgi:hypothetical protein
MLLNLEPSHSRLREVAVSVSATSAGAEGVPISSGVTTYNLRLGSGYLCRSLTSTGLGDWKRKSVLVDVDSVFKTSPVCVVAFDN